MNDRTTLLAIYAALAAAPKGLTTRDLSKQIVAARGPSRFMIPQAYAKDIIDELRRRGEVERRGTRYIVLTRPVALPEGWLLGGCTNGCWALESPHYSAAGNYVRLYQTDTPGIVQGGAGLFVHVGYGGPVLDAIKREAARIGAHVNTRRHSSIHGLLGNLSAPIEAADALARTISRLSYELTGHCVAPKKC